MVVASHQKAVYHASSDRALFLHFLLINSVLDQELRHSCYLNCLAPVIDAISQPSLAYDTVLDLDMRIRDFSFPSPLKSKNDNSRFAIAQKASLSTALEAGESTRPVNSTKHYLSI